MKTRIEKMLNDKRAQEEKLRAALIESETKEERAAIGETMKALAAEIKECEEILAEMDEPAGGEGGAAGEGGARSAVVVATTRSAGEPGNDAAKQAEERAKAFANTGRMNIEAGEARSVLLSSGSIAKPTSVGGINDPFNVVSSIVDMVRVEDMTGMGGHKEAFVKSWQAAGTLTDGTAPTAADPVFGTCVINPFLMGVVTYVSRELKKQTPLQYEAKVREGALVALKKKLAAWIAGGNGTTEIYGIVNAVNTDSTNNAMYATLDMKGEIDEKTLRSIVFAYGGDENVGSNAVLMLNKKDLIAFGDVRGTSEKKAVYEIIPDGANPNKGIIKDGGLSVPYVICSDATAHTGATGTSAGVKTMIYGDPHNYKLGLFGNYEVNVSEDYKFAEGLLTVRGEVMVGGNVIVDKGFVVVTKKSA